MRRIHSLLCAFGFAAVGSAALPVFAIDNPALFAFPYKTDITAKGTYASTAIGTDYVLSGTISGTVTLTNTCSEARVTLNGVNLTGQLVLCGAAHYFIYAVPGTVNVISNAAKTAVLATDNTVTLCGPGSATFIGGGSKKTAAVLVAKKLHVNGGDTSVISTIAGAKSYVVYAKSAFGVHQGRISATGTDTSSKAVGVALGGAATVTLDGGRIDVSLAGPKSVAIGDDADDITLSGTACFFSLAGTAAKGFKTDGTFTMTGGILNASLAGDAIFEPFEGSDGTNTLWYSVASANTSVLAAGTYLVYDTSTAYAIKAGTIAISGGHCRIAATGVAGRGIGGDVVTISGGTFDISVAGASTQQYVAFLDDDPVADANYVTCVDRGSACCIKQGSPTNALTITGGSFYLVATGNGGKCISADGTTVIGAASATNTLPTDATFAPDIQASTFGEHLYVAAVKVKNGGTTGTAAAFVATNVASYSVTTNLTSISNAVVVATGDEIDYTNPKGMKVEGKITMNGGRLRVYSKNDGGEGMESKDSITFNGGLFEGATYDDCVNAATNITVNGGYLYVGSTGNDGLDSNGTFNINGGVILAFTATTPEVGIDTDTSTGITITGGIVVSLGTADNMTYAGNSSSSQASVVATMASSSYCGHYITLSGTKTVTVYIPAFSSTSGTFYGLVTCPGYTGYSSTSTVPATGAIGFHGVYEN